MRSRFFLCLLLVPVLLILPACLKGSSSGSDLLLTTGVDFTGVYTPTADTLVSQNSGNSIDLLNLSQSGSELEAFDNNGNIWRGRLGRVDNGEADFRLDGQTTAGSAAQIVGTLSGEGTTGSMFGTFIEAGTFGVVSGTASIANVQTNAPSGGAGTLAISPTGAQTLTAGQTRQFSASGGTEPYNWTVGNSGIGTLSVRTGQQTTYSAISSGTQTVTVTDGAGQSQSTTISQTGGFGVGNQGINLGGNGLVF